MIVLAPSTVQEMADFVRLAFELAFKYRNPVMILTDGALGQMMEKVELEPQQERAVREFDWSTTGRKNGNGRVITSLHLQPDKMEEINIRLQKKYREIEKKEVRFEAINCDDAEYIIVAYGLVARICQKAAELAREKGIKTGIFRPITLFPFPYNELKKYAGNVKGILDVEMNAGQMVEDVKLAVEGGLPVHFHGRMGGIVPSPEEILEKLEAEVAGGKK
jgi:2-oxoglutarate ferredoxin oxidoreductase subunit alpha